MEGWIKLHRKMIDWEWYSDLSAKAVFIHLLITANSEDTTWRGIRILRGEHLTSWRKLAGELDMALSAVQRAVKKLESSNDVEVKAEKDYTIFKVVHYEDYQCVPQDVPLKGTKMSTQKGTQRGTKQELKKEEERNILTHSPLTPIDKEYRMTEEEWGKVAETYNQVTSGKAMPIPQPISEEMRRLISGLIRIHGKQKLLEGMQIVANNGYLCSRDVEWIFSATTFNKILNHEYDERETTGKYSRRDSKLINGYTYEEWEAADARANARIDNLEERR